MGRGVPSLEEGVGDHVAEGFGFHGFVLLEGVEIDLLFHPSWEGLDIGAQPAESHNDVVLHFEDPLEIIGESHHLLSKSSICGNADAIFTDHAYDATSIVFKDRHI